jgi:pilus assembly protein CpaB
MNRTVFTILLSAFFVAAGCTYLVFRILGSRIGAPQQHTTRVVVAAKDVPLGAVLTPADISTSDFAGTLPKGALLKPEDAVGRGVVSDLYQGEPVLENRLAAPGAGGGLAATIRHGMRACAVRVDEVVGVAGFVTPGMRVDVLISGNPPGTNTNANGMEVKTLLQNIQVLSAGTDIQKDDQGKPKQVQVVNLLVSPEEAELLSLASNQARIQLVLRNPLDTELAHPPRLATVNLFSDSTAPKPTTGGHVRVPRAAPQIYLVEVFNGSKHSQEKFVSGEGK